MSGRGRPAPGGAEPWAPPDIVVLRSALMVREHLGFRRASEALGVNPSVLSRRVLSLEDALGVSLFQRTPGGARPTGAGERFLAEVERALQLLQRAAARAGAAGRGEVGRLRVGHVWPVSAGPAAEALRAYRRAAGEVEIELREGAAAGLAAAVLDRELDVALIDAEEAPPGLERLALWSEPWLLAAPAGAEPGGDEPVLCAASDDCGRIRRLARERGGSRAGVRVQMTSHDGVLSLVAAGAGLAVVPQSVADSLAPAAATAVSFAVLPGPPLRLCAAWRGDHDNPALRRFLSQLRGTGFGPAPAAALKLAGGAR